MKSPERKIILPTGFMLMQPNMTFESIEEANLISPARVWKDLECGRYCCQILVEKPKQK
jgi:hypothetical protein